MDRDNFKDGKYYSSEAIKRYLLILKNIYKVDYNKFNTNYENHTGTYFIQIYQILKFIKNSTIKNQQLYVNILRAQFTKEELEFLFYHCLGSIGSQKFKPLLEDFEFFEHLALNPNIEKNLTKYNKSIYGKKEAILAKYDELKEH